MNAPPDVLVVDDDPDLIEILQIMLRTSGYEVRCARNGKEAIEAVTQKAPAVILLDMLMPVMDGSECARVLRARFGRTVPIVVMTAAEHARARADEVGGVDDVLSKPFEMDDLVRVVDRYVSKRASSGSSRP